MPAHVPAFLFSQSVREISNFIKSGFSSKSRDMPYLRFVFIFLASLTLLSITALSQGKEDKSRELFQIRQIFQRTNSDTGYQLVKLEDAEKILGHVTDGGASLTGYYKGDSLRKIIEWVGLSNRVIQNEYYLNKGNLVFVYSTEKQYAYNDSLQALDYTKLVPAYYGRYYFKNNQLYDVTLSNKRLKQSEKSDAAAFLSKVKTYAVLLQQGKK